MASASARISIAEANPSIIAISSAVALGVSPHASATNLGASVEAPGSNSAYAYGNNAHVEVHNHHYYPTSMSILTADYLNTLRERLRNKYNPAVEPMYCKAMAGDSLARLYTQLALVREIDVNKNLKKDEKAKADLEKLEGVEYNEAIMRAEHPYFRDRLLRKQLISIQEEDLFTVNTDDSDAVHKKAKIERILIRGQAGVGKTTFSKHYAQLLMDKKEQEKYVFVIPLRKLRNKAGLLESAEVLKSVIASFSDFSIEQIRELLQKKEQQIYWLLDGYDEIADLDEMHALSQWLEKMFKQDRVILISRPRTVSEFRADRIIEMIGFADKDIYGEASKEVVDEHQGYIDRYFGEEKEVGADLKKYLKVNPQLIGLARVPLILELCCYVWLQFANKLKSLHGVITLSSLYKFVDHALARRYLAKSSLISTQLAAKSVNIKDVLEDEDLIEDELNKNKINQFLSLLAYETFNKGQFILTGLDIKEIISNYAFSIAIGIQSEILKGYGLITCIDDTPEDFREKEYSYQHLTFQEYLAAKHWVSLFLSENSAEQASAKELFKKEKYNKRYEWVWGFVAGLLKERHAELGEFFKLLLAPPLDMLGIRQMNLVIQALGESSSLSGCEREYKLIQDWLAQDSALRFIGIEDFGATLARYPDLIHGPLKHSFINLYETDEILALELYNLGARYQEDVFVEAILRKIKMEENTYEKIRYIQILGNLKLEGMALHAAVEFLIGILEDPSEKFDPREEAGRSLGKFEVEGELLKKVIKALAMAYNEYSTAWDGSTDPYAIIALGRQKVTGRNLAFVVSVLFDARCSGGWYNGKHHVVEAAKQALEDLKISKRSHELTEALLEVIENPCETEDLRNNAIDILGKSGFCVNFLLRTVKILLKTIKSLHNSRLFLKDLNVKGKASSELVDILLRECTSEFKEMSVFAVRALGQLEVDKVDLGRVIIELLRACENDRTKETAYGALENIQGIKEIGAEEAKALSEHFYAILEYSDELRLMNIACRILGKLNFKSIHLRKIYTELLAILTNKENLEPDRIQAAIDLGNIEIEDELAYQRLAALFKILEDKEESIDIKRPSALVLGSLKISDEFLSKVINLIIQQMLNSIDYQAFLTINIIKENLPMVIVSLKHLFFDYRAEIWQKVALVNIYIDLEMVDPEFLDELISFLKVILINCRENNYWLEDALLALRRIKITKESQLDEVVHWLLNILANCSGDLKLRSKAVLTLKSLNKSGLVMRKALPILVMILKNSSEQEFLHKCILESLEDIEIRTPELVSFYALLLKLYCKKEFQSSAAKILNKLQFNEEEVGKVVKYILAVLENPAEDLLLKNAVFYTLGMLKIKGHLLDSVIVITMKIIMNPEGDKKQKKLAIGLLKTLEIKDRLLLQVIRDLLSILADESEAARSIQNEAVEQLQEFHRTNILIQEVSADSSSAATFLSVGYVLSQGGPAASAGVRKS